jgi:hypothetical protein
MYNVYSICPYRTGILYFSCWIKYDQSLYMCSTTVLWKMNLRTGGVRHLYDYSTTVYCVIQCKNGTTIACRVFTSILLSLRTSKHHTNYLATVKTLPAQSHPVGKRVYSAVLWCPTPLHLLGRNDKKGLSHVNITILHKEYFLQNGIRVKQWNYSTISRCLVLINIVIYRVW